tara:strand:+ start:803 stop:1405 length:603 start_codon:yes stop_codon:yes gene_type:complete
MYYPKSQIKTNLTTQGQEFVFASNKKPYKGKYWKTSKGTFYTGENPNDGSPLKLIPIDTLKPHSEIKNNSTHSHTDSREYDMYLLDDSYYSARGIKSRNQPPRNPISSKPKIGEKITERYFVSKTNEPQFIEVSKVEFQKFESKSSEVNWSLYESIKLNWKTDGTQEEAYLYNKNQVLKQYILGFEFYFKGKFDNYWLGK